MTGERSPYRWAKTVVFALLVLNTAVYCVSGTFSEALDSAAWLTLLVLFALEAVHGKHIRNASAIAAIRVTRLAAAGALVAALAGYVLEREWLDAVNIGLWLLVVGLLEFEVRKPAAVARHRQGFAAVAATLYSALGAVVLAWLWQEDWFDAYDAALWLIAFAAIELDLLRPARRGDGVRSAAPEPG